MFLLLFITISLADTGTFIIASQSNITSAWKGLIAHVYSTMIYHPHADHRINIYDGDHMVLNWTSTLQRDVIINGINQISRNNTCDWHSLLHMDMSSYGHYIFLFTDGNSCSHSSLMADYVPMESGHHRIIFPVAVGDAVDMFPIMCMAGPCAPPRGCVLGRDYLHLKLSSFIV